MSKWLLVLAGILLLAPPAWLRAQSRAEAGVFLDSLHISQTSTENVGIGGRFGYRVYPHVMLEGELSYDFGVNFQETYRNIANGAIAAVENTSIGVTEGWVGPTLEPAHGHFRPFATLKAGFVDFRLSPSLIPYSSVVTTALGIRTSTLNAAIYPGGGVVASLGPVGLRLEFDDALYFNSGAHNDLRITFGPVVRF